MRQLLLINHSSLDILLRQITQLLEPLDMQLYSSNT